MEEILNTERRKVTFHTSHFRRVLYGDNEAIITQGLASFEKEVTLDANIYNEGRIHMIKDTIKTLPSVVRVLDMKNHWSLVPIFLYMQNQFPGSVHLSMFLMSLELMGSEEQKGRFFEKSMTGEILGCYAQTELGHGSDVQSIETTATLDKTTDEFVIHTPSVSATKFWPGDLGIFANHAVVYAKIIVDGNSLGVYPLIARIRDQNHQPMPGVQCGDIGPKVGYITKDNGYLSFHQVRVPRSNLLSKLIDVSAQGELEIKGDPKVLYASMMLIRKIIVGMFPKLYSNGLTIAVRYSLFRKMFRDDRGHEVTIADYQTQENKLLPLIADYYAFSIDGNAVIKLTEENFERVTQKNDGSLMEECHSSLCYSKAYISEEVSEGLEILRKACGGHGFSHYSGLPNLCVEFYAHPIHEGENTVLYLQVSRYILKNYKRMVEKGKGKLGRTVSYLENYQDLIKYRPKLMGEDPREWSREQVGNILSHMVCHNLSVVLEKQEKFKPLGTKDVNNLKAGISLVELGKSHSLYNMFKSFAEVASNCEADSDKKVMTSLCLMFGIHRILANPRSAIESTCLQPSHIASLKRQKQNLLKCLRPQMIGLVDSFIVSEVGLKSALTFGDVYKNLFKLAKENPINQSIPESVWTVKRVSNVRPKM